MNEAEFDRFADEYENQNRRNIAVTGESPGSQSKSTGTLLIADEGWGPRQANI